LSNLKKTLNDHKIRVYHIVVVPFVVVVAILSAAFKLSHLPSIETESITMREKHRERK